MRLRTAIERSLAPGYSTCYRCRRPWKFVQEHVTDYTPNSGCFPLCEACWQELGSPERRMPYYERLWDEWQRDGTDKPGATWLYIKAAVKAGR